MSTAPAIAATIQAEPGWRAICLDVPLQVANAAKTRVQVKIVRFIAWGLTCEGKLWPLGMNGRPLERLEGVCVPSDATDEELSEDCRKRLQARADAAFAPEPTLPSLLNDVISEAMEPGAFDPNADYVISRSTFGRLIKARDALEKETT